MHNYSTTFQNYKSCLSRFEVAPNHAPFHAISILTIYPGNNPPVLKILTMDFSSGIKEEKCHVTYGLMGHLDPKQLPMNRKPFSAILNHDFVQKVELIIPEALYSNLEETFLGTESWPKYCHVILQLKELLEGEFFNEYIKKGNILMISEGKRGAENTYILKDGKLTLYLDKESYERAGIVGKPDGRKGSRGTKPRWVVDIDLRLPSMQRGKKGFDRIVYAFKNTLTLPVTWLFCNLEATCPTPDPLDKNFPVRKTIIPEITKEITVAMPSLFPTIDGKNEYEEDFQDYAVNIHEWFSLVMLKSPCVEDRNEIDPVLSRYSAPGDTQKNKLVKISWHGFISPTWIHRLFVRVLLAIPTDAWITFDVTGFPVGLTDKRHSCMILKLPKSPQEYVLWEVN